MTVRGRLSRARAHCIHEARIQLGRENPTWAVVAQPLRAHARAVAGDEEIDAPLPLRERLRLRCAALQGQFLTGNGVPDEEPVPPSTGNVGAGIFTRRAYSAMAAAAITCPSGMVTNMPT
jgi:hypothetical protein